MSLRTTLEQHLEAMKSIVSELEPDSLSGAEAALLVTSFATGAHVCNAGKAICARVVAATGHFESEGHRDAASWLAETSGETKGAARDLLETADALVGLPELAGAFCSGELSDKKALEIARAGVIDPSSEHDLVEAAQATSLGELRDKASAVRAAARAHEEDDEAHRRLHARRNLSTWTDKEGAFEGRFSLTPEDGASLMGRLGELASLLFEESRAKGITERRGAHLADALVLLARGETPSTSPETPEGSETAPATGQRRLPAPDYTILMRVDLEALVRGHLARGEECSIDSGGHVPLSVVQSYLDEARLRLVVTKGTDVCSVFSFSRTIPAALKTALLARDRSCVVPGCGSSFRLEIDHIKEFARGGPTALSNLCRLCTYHHRLKSVSGYRIEGGPGAWRWVAPPRAGSGAPPGSRSVRSARDDGPAPEAAFPSGGPPGQPGAMQEPSHERCEQVSLLP